ncbi:hypothetical protein D3C76_1451460 [compost metagenome]
MAASVAQRILKMVQVTVNLFVFHLDVGERRARRRIPVNDIFAAVNQALLIELDEHFANRLRQPLVQREPLTRIIEGSAHFGPLFMNRFRILVLPGPYLIEELLAPEVVPRHALLS